MKKKTGIIISLIIITLILTVVLLYKGYLRPFSTSSEWKKGSLILTSENYEQQNPDIIKLSNNCWRMYTHGWPNDNNHENDVYSFYSCDGINWKSEGIRIKNASHPAAVMLDDGRIRIYTQHNPDEEHITISLNVFISEDGLNFESDGKINLKGEGLEYIRTIAHLEIVKLENGYRIYFDEGGLRADELERNKGTGWNWPVQWIRSMYSEDGFNWVLEPGIRIDMEQEPLKEMQRAGSCSVIEQNGKYHMYFYAGFSPWEDLKPYKRWEWSGTYEAISDDGLYFTIIDKRLVTGGDVKVVKNDDFLWMYVSEGVQMSQGKNDIYIYIKKL